jgi:hypothetical protein
MLDHNPGLDEEWRRTRQALFRWSARPIGPLTPQTINFLLRSGVTELVSEQNGVRVVPTVVLIFAVTDEPADGNKQTV